MHSISLEMYQGFLAHKPDFLLGVLRSVPATVALGGARFAQSPRLCRLPCAAWSQVPQRTGLGAQHTARPGCPGTPTHSRPCSTPASSSGRENGQERSRVLKGSAQAQVVLPEAAGRQPWGDGWGAGRAERPGPRGSWPHIWLKHEPARRASSNLASAQFSARFKVMWPLLCLCDSELIDPNN